MDLLRLNMAIEPTAAVGKGDRLGVLNGDLAGFPNGRRLEDDVADIEVRAIAQGYGSFSRHPGLPDKSPNDLLGDGDDRTTPPQKGLSRPRSRTCPSPSQGYEVVPAAAPAGTTSLRLAPDTCAVRLPRALGLLRPECYLSDANHLRWQGRAQEGNT